MSSGNVPGTRADEVHLLTVIPDGHAHEALEIAPVHRSVPGIDDGALKSNEGRLVGRIEGGRRPEGGYESFGAAGGRCLAFDRKGRTCLLGVQVADCASEDERVVSPDKRVRFFVHPRAHAFHEPRRAPYGRTEPGSTEQVVRDAMARGPPALAGDVPGSIERVDIAPGTDVFEVQRAPGERLVEEPDPPAVGAGRLRPDPRLQLARIDGLQAGSQHTEIRRLVTKHEPEMGYGRFAGGILPGIELDDSRAVHLGSPCTRDQVALHGRGRNLEAELLSEPRLAYRASFLCDQRADHPKSVTLMPKGLGISILVQERLWITGLLHAAPRPVDRAYVQF